MTIKKAHKSRFAPFTQGNESFPQKVRLAYRALALRNKRVANVAIRPSSMQTGPRIGVLDSNDIGRKFEMHTPSMQGHTSKDHRYFYEDQ